MLFLLLDLFVWFALLGLLRRYDGVVISLLLGALVLGIWFVLVVI